MSKDIERVRARLAAEREEKFRVKLAELVDEMEAEKRAADFFIEEILIPAWS